MKNTYIIVIVVIALAVGAVFIFGGGQKVEAPVSKTPDSPISQTTLKEFTVTGNNFSFTPSLITVQKGDRVKITFNNVNGFHDFRIDAFDASTSKTQSPTTEVLEFVADKTGSFEFYCSVGSHKAMGMKGTLKVE